MTFSPALGTPAATGTLVLDWGATLGAVDYHLASGSMCINAADPATAPSTDILGATRVNPDIGAYESP